MASIIVRGNKLSLRYYDKQTGTKQTIALHLPNNRAGMREATQQKKLIEANLLDKYYSTDKIIKNKLSIDEAAALFSEVKKHSKSTVTGTNLAVKHLKIATKKEYVTDLTQADFQKFSLYLSKVIGGNGKKFSPNTKSIYSRSLSNMFTWLKAGKYVNENHVISEKGEVKQIETIPEVEIEQIKNYLYMNNKNAYYFIRILELTGLRKSSALALTWEQIDYETEIISIENVKKNRTFIFPLTKEILSLLEEMGIKKEGKVFAYSKDGLKFWDRVQKRLGLQKKYGLHQIRKTFISKLANSGVSLYDVATLADHRNIQTTFKYYAKSNISRLKDVLDNQTVPQTVPQMGNTKGSYNRNAINKV